VSLITIPDRLKIVNPAILKEVDKQVHGDWSRVVAHSPTEVTVYNTTQTHRTELPPAITTKRRMPHRRTTPVVPPAQDQVVDGWRFSNHAAVRMLQRGITMAQVLEALQQPDWTHPSPTDPDIQKARLGNLVVVYEPETKNIVTTAWVDECEDTDQKSG
jgi:hypothetical protein